MWSISHENILQQQLQLQCQVYCHKLMQKSQSDHWNCPQHNHPISLSVEMTTHLYTQLLSYMICCVLGITWISLWVWKLLKKFRYRSNVLRALFPCAPGSQWLNTEVHTDIFLQIINVMSAKVVWAKLTSMAGLPENFVQWGSLNVDAIDMTPLCCRICAKLEIEWRHTVLYNKVTNMQVHLPRSVWTSMFLPRHYINKDDWHLCHVQLHACMLDLFVPIKVELYDSAMGSAFRSTGAAVTSLPTGLRVQLPEALAPSHQEVLQELCYEPAPHKALTELRRYDKYPQIL